MPKPSAISTTTVIVNSTHGSVGVAAVAGMLAAGTAVGLIGAAAAGTAVGFTGAAAAASVFASNSEAPLTLTLRTGSDFISNAGTA